MNVNPNFYARGVQANDMRNEIQATHQQKLAQQAQNFWMLLPEPDTLQQTRGGNLQIADAIAHRILYFDETEARREAARLAVSHERRVFVLKCVASCAPPEPEAPPVQWTETVLQLEEDKEAVREKMGANKGTTKAKSKK